MTMGDGGDGGGTSTTELSDSSSMIMMTFFSISIKIIIHRQRSSRFISNFGALGFKMMFMQNTKLLTFFAII